MPVGDLVLNGIVVMFSCLRGQVGNEPIVLMCAMSLANLDSPLYSGYETIVIEITEKRAF